MKHYEKLIKDNVDCRAMLPHVAPTVEHAFRLGYMCAVAELRKIDNDENVQGYIDYLMRDAEKDGEV